MSWPAVRAAFKVGLPGWDTRRHGRPAMAKLVLVTLAYRTNIEGQAWPSLAALMTDTGLSRASVCRALDGLLAEGHIEVIHRHGHSSIFHVDPSQWETYPSQGETSEVSAGDLELIKGIGKEPRRFRHSRNCPCHGTGWLDTWDPSARALIAVACPDGPQP